MSHTERNSLSKKKGSNMSDWFYKIKNREDAINALKKFNVSCLEGDISTLVNKTGKNIFVRMYDADNYNPDWDHAKICYVVYYILWGKIFKELYKNEDAETDFGKFLKYFGGETIFPNKKMTIGNFMILPKHRNEIEIDGKKYRPCLNNYRYQCLRDDPFRTFVNYRIFIERDNPSTKLQEILKKNPDIKHDNFQKLLEKYPDFFGNNWNKFLEDFDFESNTIDDYLEKQKIIIDNFIDQRTEKMISALINKL